MRPFKGRCPARKRQGVCGKNGVAGAGDVNSLIAAVNGDLHEAIGRLVDAGGPAVSADTDLPELARVMTDYNLMTLPVVDGDGKPIGLLAVDDVLELMLPGDWRRRYGLARD